MTGETPRKSQGMKPWLKIVFALSLALNLAVVGIVGGAMFRFDKREGGMRSPPVGALLYRELSKEDRREIRAAADQDFSKRDERRKEEAEELAAALRQVPFDPNLVESLLLAQTKKVDDFQASVRALWLARVSEMSDAERADYAERLKDAMLKPPSKKGPKPPKPD